MLVISEVAVGAVDRLQVLAGQLCYSASCAPSQNPKNS